MYNLFLKILIASYGATAIVDIIAYWPTIKDLYYNKKPSANISSYLMWSITTGIAFLYSLLILPNLLFRIVSGTFFCANILVLLLSLKLSK